VAAGLLSETLRAVLETTAARRVLALDGVTGDWLPDGFEVIAQRGRELGERLAHAFEDVGAPALVIGMDTPQVTPLLLEDSLRVLEQPENDAIVGPTPDGGYWTIGLKRADARVFSGVPMSSSRTLESQLERLGELGLRCASLPQLRDVDGIDDALLVAGSLPDGPFARALEGALQEATVAAP